jgi:hypothetical protein
MTKTPNSGTGHSGDAPSATLISVILDRSGSMTSLREPTIEGFNEFVKTQREQADGGRALMSLTQFDTRFEVNFVGEPIENVPKLDGHSYIPRGGTALYDAIGRTIHEVEAWTRDHEWKERVLVLIVTDGEENSSREFTFKDARELIEKKEKEGWNFAYMGANQDSYAVGGSLNIRRGFSANYAATAGGVLDQYRLMSVGASAYRQAGLKGAGAPGIFREEPEEIPSEGKLVGKDTGRK